MHRREMSQPADVLFDAVLPENADVERLVLAYILTTSGGYRKVAESLVGDDFSLEKHKRIFRHIGELAGRAQKIDRVTVAESLQRNKELEIVDGISYLISLDDNMPALRNIDEYIRIVREKSMARRIAMLCESTVGNILQQSDDLSVLSDALVKGVRETMARSVVNPTQRVGEYIDTLTSAEIQNPKLVDPGLMFGFSRLDEATDGLHLGETAIFAAGPGEGKTALLYQIVRNNAKPGDREGILILSLEMRKRSMFNRFACAMAGISVQRYRQGLDNPNEAGRFLEAVEQLRELPIYFEDTPGLNHVQVRNKVEETLMRTPLKLVALDYIQLVSPTAARSGENDKLTEFCNAWQIMTMDKSLGLRSILLSQLNRDNRKLKQKPGLPALRGSGTIEQIGNIIGFLYFENQKTEGNRGRGSLLLEKNREGESHLEIPIQFYGWRQEFEEREEGMVSYGE